ncbi:hypothetical protein AB0I81_24100 [Nonomuraea sp. NPDC050404]|uniref:hypothetical protein n=1 Tax=Nonomuraea sp. NPDC050404 TaxID=3155783 RepID=UPI0033CCF7FB
MRKRLQRRGARVRTTVLLLAGGAAAIAAVATALIGTGPTGQKDSPPRAADASQDITGDDGPSISILWGKPSAPPSSAAPALPRVKTDEKDDSAAGSRARAVESHRRHELLPAEQAADRRTSRPGHRARRAPGGPRPASPAASRREGSQSLLAMRCDEMFPPQEQGFRLRNLACHRLLG